MLFNSFHFFVFFIVVTITYFALPHRYRWLLLLASSCYFYMAFVPVYLLILGFTIVIDYFSGLYIEKTTGKRKKLYLIISLAANIGVLAFFKYYNFLNENLTVLLHGAGYQNPVPSLAILLPLGLSFHTFQAMSYTIEIYRGNQAAEKHFGIYALYVMFYPQLVAGPIERPQNLLHQFYEKHRFDYHRITDGLKLMAWGLFKKVVIADRLAVVVDHVYGSPQDHGSIILLLATVFFSFQIYCDFSGYSDMAIGAAQVMGFRLMKNFDRPYHAKNIREFWGRWHISLSTWFRDYLYIPLGGNRVSFPRWYINLFIVFVISGLWHGANWTFIVWGALHGFFMVFGLITQNWRNNMAQKTGLHQYPVIYNTLSVVTTFLLVSFAWIFFRADSISNAYYILKKIIYGLPDELAQILHNAPVNLDLGTSPVELVVALSAIIFMEVIHGLQNKYEIPKLLNSQPVVVRWAVYYAAVFIVLFLGIYENRQFIYFQF